MGRGVQLQELEARLRVEAGHSPTMSVSADSAQVFRDKLRHTQAFLYEEWDWPFLRRQWQMPLQTGERFYDVPEGLNYDRIETAFVYWNDLPERLTYGITDAQYATYNSMLDERSDPACRWDIRHTGRKEQIEVWPIPASQTNHFIQFTGIKKLNPLVADTDRAELDDLLLIYTAAADLLLAQGSGNARAMALMAERRFRRLKSSSAGPRENFKIGENQRSRPRNDGHVTIRVR